MFSKGSKKESWGAGGGLGRFLGFRLFEKCVCCFHLLKYVICSPVGLKGNLLLQDSFCFFFFVKKKKKKKSEGLKQLEVWLQSPLRSVGFEHSAGFLVFVVALVLMEHGTPKIGPFDTPTPTAPYSSGGGRGTSKPQDP